MRGFLPDAVQLGVSSVVSIFTQRYKGTFFASSKPVEDVKPTSDNSSEISSETGTQEEVKPTNDNSSETPSETGARESTITTVSVSSDNEEFYDTPEVSEDSKIVLDEGNTTDEQALDFNKVKTYYKEMQ